MLGQAVKLFGNSKLTFNTALVMVEAYENGVQIMTRTTVLKLWNRRKR